MATGIARTASHRMNTYAAQTQHQIKPFSDIQAMMKTDTHAKDIIKTD